MPKGQQRGNKEAKKQKQATAPKAAPAGIAHAPAIVKSAPPRWLKK